MSHKIFDAHSHIQFPAYDADREAAILRARNLGIKMIAVGTQYGTSKKAIELAEKYPNDVWATVGFHPNHTGDSWHHDKNEQSQAEPEKFNIEKLREIAKNPKVVAIGECGLDYFRLSAKRESQMAEQKEVFLRQIELAKELQKPLMIHCRASKGTDDAYEEAFSILSNVNGQLSKVLHFYAGSISVTKKFVDVGYYFTFGGVITFSRDYDEVIKYIPLNRIMLETDAPYVAPTPYRGVKNEPAYVVEVAKRFAEIKNKSFKEIIESTTTNTLQVFDIKL